MKNLKIKMKLAKKCLPTREGFEFEPLDFGGSITQVNPRQIFFS